MFTLLKSIAIVSLALLTACDKGPDVFSFNNFSSLLMNDEPVKTVTQLTFKGLEGTWRGRDHNIELSEFSTSRSRPDGSFSKLDYYEAAVIYTDGNGRGSIDVSMYSILFIKVSGQPFVELISKGTHDNDYDFSFRVSTWLKINKLSRDTIIVQLPTSKFATAYMKANSFSYFIPAEYRNKKEFPVYITEDPDRLADLLKSLSRFPEAFQAPDTLLRLR